MSVHDGWKPYQAHTTCRHALCNVHHLRELTFVEEQYDHAWAKQLKDLLLEMRAATEQARAHGQAHVPAKERDGLVARYGQLLARGLAANPPPPRRPPAARTGQAIAGPQSARAPVAGTGARLGFPRRPEHPL